RLLCGLLELSALELGAIERVQLGARFLADLDHLAYGRAVLQLQPVDAIEPTSDELEAGGIALDRRRVVTHAAAELLDAVERSGEHLVRVLLGGIDPDEMIERPAHLSESGAERLVRRVQRH